VEIVSHPDFARLHPTGEHPERPERIRALHEAFPDFTRARFATVDELSACHDLEYVELVRSVSESGRTAMLDPDTICTPSSFRAAVLAAGAAMQAAEAGGFAFVRPPGHHALAGRAMGFCLFNNVAVAARYAQRELGASRVAILDWDVHHGNGTQDLFWDDPSVLVVSLHRWPFYPGTGGPGEGNETTVNVPLPAGSGDDQYLAAMDELVEPGIREFTPDLLLVSAGYDAAAGDPLGGMLLTADGYRELARRARGVCERIGCVLEGGYNVETLPVLVAATLEGLADTGKL
jgi:acetoin utilization deacetylase AcuC-like enzyme